MPSLFEPINVGAIQLANRVIMAPMTRSRAKPDGTPGDRLEAWHAAALVRGHHQRRTPSTVAACLHQGPDLDP